MGNCIAVCVRVQKPVMPSIEINNEDDLIQKELEIDDVVIPQAKPQQINQLENTKIQESNPSKEESKQQALLPQIIENLRQQSFNNENKQNEEYVNTSSKKIKQESENLVKQSKIPLRESVDSQKNKQSKINNSKVIQEDLKKSTHSISNVTKPNIEYTPLKAKSIRQNQLISKSIGSNRPIKLDRIELENGIIYQGQWLNGIRQGKGTQIWIDGSKYIGQWKNNQANGFGILYHSDGDIYQGQWQNDKANGQGTYTHSNGAKYKGQWKDDKQSGHGVEQWLDGARYEGEYEDGAKNGKGVLKFLDGSYYEGQFLNNQIHGFGTYIWAQNRKYEGYWAHNKMHGKGKIVWNDGRKYEGDYLNDRKHGFGIFQWADGRKYIGNWCQGKQHGRGEYISPKGQKRIGEWVQGKRIKWLDQMPSKQQ